MTNKQAALCKEINLYHQRLGRWPNVSTLAYLMKITQPAMTTMIKRMEARGYIEQVGGWKNGQTKQFKTC